MFDVGRRYRYRAGIAFRDRSTRRRTATSEFGAGARENHDASAFYRRFRPPELSSDDTVAGPIEIAEPFVCGDARHLATVADRSVALVVTSPPYFAGKQYEVELERDGIPASYLEYLDVLRQVFAECVRTLEPGGRLAVNVANLGRKPYRSLSADVIRILEDDLGLLLRGELIWQKAEGASGSCAWGSFRSAANPTLRDLTERIVVASKGRFDRARTVRQRAAAGLPHVSSIGADDFMAGTLDVWTMPAESARHVGHPAPFPVELPEQLIRLYTYVDDLVLDPFMGSGSTLVAAARLGRRYVGYDLDAQYVELARRRVAGELAHGGSTDEVVAAGGPSATRLALQALEAAGFVVTGRRRRARRTGLAVDVVATDTHGDEWWFDVVGPLSARRSGLQRPDAVLRTLGRAVALRNARGPTPFVVLTTALPRPGSDGDLALRAAGAAAITDVIDLLDDDARGRLHHFAERGVKGPTLHLW